MPDIHIERIHHLGFSEARRAADRWSEEAAKKLGLVFTVEPGDTRDIHQFARDGVKGSLVVSADRFAIDAKLGILLRAFSKKIEAEIERTFDDLLNAAQAPSTEGRDPR